MKDIEWRGHCVRIELLASGHMLVAALFLNAGAVLAQFDSVKTSLNLLIVSQGWVPFSNSAQRGVTKGFVVQEWKLKWMTGMWQDNMVTLCCIDSHVLHLLAVNHSCTSKVTIQGYLDLKVSWLVIIYPTFFICCLTLWGNINMCYVYYTSFA